MLARASAQAGDGAGALFARLDADATDATDAVSTGVRAEPAPNRRRAEAERLLARWAARIHAGEWNDGIGELVLMAQTLERAFPASSTIIAEKSATVTTELAPPRRGLPSTN